MRFAFWLVFGFVAFEAIDGHLHCKRTRKDDNRYTTPPPSSTEYPTLRPILDLKPIASLEGICFQICNNCTGGGVISNVGDVLGSLLGGNNNPQSGLGAGLLGGSSSQYGSGLLSGLGKRRRRDLLGGVLGGRSDKGSSNGKGGESGGLVDGVVDTLIGSNEGGTEGVVGSVLGGQLLHNTPAQCLADQGLPITPFQACVFACILDLQLLDTCDIDVILSKVEAICPNRDNRAICASIGLCCADDSVSLPEFIDVCLTKNKGTGTPRIPIFSTPPSANLLPENIINGLPGVHLGSHRDHQGYQHSGQGSSYGSGRGGSSGHSNQGYGNQGSSYGSGQSSGSSYASSNSGYGK